MNKIAVVATVGRENQEAMIKSILFGREIRLHIVPITVTGVTKTSVEN